MVNCMLFHMFFKNILAMWCLDYETCLSATSVVGKLVLPTPICRQEALCSLDVHSSVCSYFHAKCIFTIHVSLQLNMTLAPNFRDKGQWHGDENIRFCNLRVKVMIGPNIGEKYASGAISPSVFTVHEFFTVRNAHRAICNMLMNLRLIQRSRS